VKTLQKTNTGARIMYDKKFVYFCMGMAAIVGAVLISSIFPGSSNKESETGKIDRYAQVYLDFVSGKPIKGSEAWWYNRTGTVSTYYQEAVSMKLGIDVKEMNHIIQLKTVVDHPPQSEREENEKHGSETTNYLGGRNTQI
jgi:hypothetical protein